MIKIKQFFRKYSKYAVVNKPNQLTWYKIFYVGGRLVLEFANALFNWFKSRRASIVDLGEVSSYKIFTDFKMEP